jgi:hypothetical protein
MLKERIQDLRPFVEETDALLLKTDEVAGISAQEHRVTQVDVA